MDTHPGAAQAPKLSSLCKHYAEHLWWMVDACVIIKCVIRYMRIMSMRVILEIFCKLARPKLQPVVRLCLCQSYSVLIICITGSLQNQAHPVFSLAIPATHT